jgi:putative transcriptional regulator
MARRKLVRLTATPANREQIARSVDWNRVRGMSEAEIERDLASDPDASPPLTEAEGIALNVQRIRRKLGMSQNEFAAAFQIPAATLRDWELATRAPDAAAVAYLRVIERDPQAVRRALAGRDSA